MRSHKRFFEWNIRKEEISKCVDSQDSDDNWVWQAEVEPGQGRDAGVYGLQVTFFLATLVALHFSPVSKSVSDAVGHSFGLE